MLVVHREIMSGGGAGPLLQGEEAAPEAINPVSNKSELVAGVRVTGYGDEEAVPPAITRE